MTPEQIKAKIQNAFQNAPTNVSYGRFGSTEIEHLMRDLRLFGHDAGIDFIETYFDKIVSEAVGMATQRNSSMSMPLYGCGKLAVAAIAQDLRDRTMLNVDVSNSTITLTWADNSPRLI